MWLVHSGGLADQAVAKKSKRIAPRTAKLHPNLYSTQFPYPISRGSPKRPVILCSGNCRLCTKFDLLAVYVLELSIARRIPVPTPLEHTHETLLGVSGGYTPQIRPPFIPYPAALMSYFILAR